MRLIQPGGPAGQRQLSNWPHDQYLPSNPALIIISIALLLLMIFFSIRKLRCCDKTDPFMLIKYNVKWRKTDYEDTKCEICRTYGSMMVTPCKHYFHISCF
jgi:hypothetical protein